MNNELAKLIYKLTLEKRFRGPARLSKHNASKRGHKHVHNMSKGQASHASFVQLHKKQG